MQIVSLSLFRFDTASARLWALGMMGAARLSLPRHEGLTFWKLCGSGSGEGFTPIPNTGVYAILAVWQDAATAERQLAASSLWARYRARAAEDWTLFLSPISARGRWSGAEPFAAGTDTQAGPIAALTRATVRPARAARFWRRQPDISRRIGSDPNVLFKIGIGEVPFLQQVTFSIWPDVDSMARFARSSGPHARAIRAVREGGWFREELYARFRIHGETGSWEGQSPRILVPPLPQEQCA
ncbi:spheroidene monooxygenase [Roseivivax isoporae]|uniref:Spheroidene monooxygenase n=1 Tax=Roseivivax isoporae LMG 25204 TaxID=1449351 RepID=X7F7C5_9RHOB|nr:hypothetical protein [Roseivivax isoporae]ETX28705.1 spheroidene monooxygenase [Roseivivax isoporae LMG 25204]